MTALIMQNNKNDDGTNDFLDCTSLIILASYQENLGLHATVESTNSTSQTLSVRNFLKYDSCRAVSLG
jgi:hypothetical protein